MNNRANRTNPVTPEDYKAIFEDHKTGARVLDDLILRFGSVPPKAPDGLNRVVDQFEYMGQRRVIEFIALRLGQANGERSQGETIDATPETK